MFYINLSFYYYFSSMIDTSDPSGKNKKNTCKVTYHNTKMMQTSNQNVII